MSKIWTEEELLKWLNYEDFSDDVDHHREAHEKIKDCIREAYAIPTTSEQEEELEKTIIKMQEEIDKIGASKGKLQVTEEFVEKWAGAIAPDIFRDETVRLGTISIAKDLLRTMLKEAGVEISSQQLDKSGG